MNKMGKAMIQMMSLELRRIGIKKRDVLRILKRKDGNFVLRVFYQKKGQMSLIAQDL